MSCTCGSFITISSVEVAASSVLSRTSVWATRADSSDGVFSASRRVFNYSKSPRYATLSRTALSPTERRDWQLSVRHVQQNANVIYWFRRSLVGVADRSDLVLRRHSFWLLPSAVCGKQLFCSKDWIAKPPKRNSDNPQFTVSRSANMWSISRVIARICDDSQWPTSSHRRQPTTGTLCEAYHMYMPAWQCKNQLRFIAARTAELPKQLFLCAVISQRLTDCSMSLWSHYLPNNSTR